MTVQTETSKVTALGNDSATVFSFSPVVLFASTDLEVTHVTAAGVETVLIAGTGAANYSVAVSRYPGTGSITYPADAVTPLPTGESLIMRRRLDYTQVVNLENQGGYDPDALEQALDRNVFLMQQLLEEKARSISFPLSSSITDTETNSTSASQILQINATNDGLVWVDLASGSVTATSYAQTLLLATTLDTLVQAMGTGREVLDAIQARNWNYIINGDFEVDQENEGAVYTDANGFVMDAWSVLDNVGGSYDVDVSRSTDAPAFSDGCLSGLRYSLLVDVQTGQTTATGSQYCTVRQNLIGLDILDLAPGTSAAATIYVSFWLKANKTGSLPVALRNNTAGRSYVHSVTIASADTWEEFGFSVDLDTTATGWTLDNTVGLALDFGLNVGPDLEATAADTWESADNTSLSSMTNFVSTASDTFRFSGVQITRGSRSTGYYRAPGDGEYLRCLPRYKKSYDRGVAVGTADNDGAVNWRQHSTNTVQYDAQRSLPGPPMISAPAMTWRSTATGTADTIRNVSTGADVAVTSEDHSSTVSTGHLTVSGVTDNEALRAHWVASSRI